ncbi:porin [Bradyrhizobium japonicum]|uniref:porin n=1 Tax=Bradyrhizobium japonicum TaxID=375 RepID=UPI0009B8FFAF|nr:porin [Bradyrhizobium japonicum]
MTFGRKYSHSNYRTALGILSFAAGLAEWSGTQAADLPLRAKTVAHVKVCSLYGAGFYYIPGTDTCVKLGGYLRTDLVVNSNSDFDPAYNGVAGARTRLSNAYTSRSRGDLNIDTRMATEYGTLRTFFETGLTWTDGTYSGAGTGATVYSAIAGVQAPNNASPGGIAAGTLGVYSAFIQFAGFTVGKAISQFSVPWTNYPANNYDDLPGGTGWVTGVNQFTYTADFGQGITASFSAQDQVAHATTSVWNVTAATSAGLATGAYGGNDIGGAAAPDFIAMLRVDQAWGLFQASVAAHDNHAAYNGADETTGHPADKWGWAAQLALSIKNISTGPGDTINISGVYTKGASRYDFNENMATTYAMYGGSAIAGAYQSLGLAGLSDSVFVAGTKQELTTTYGFRAGYTHNWSAYWNTGIYGGWAAVRYNHTAKAYICGAFVAGLSLSSGLAGCNPDFNYGAVGLITRWTPIKNLTFSADLAYTMLDQKYATGSVVTLPLQSTIAKPIALYELKDQGTLTLLLRAQRNW